MLKLLDLCEMLALAFSLFCHSFLLTQLLVAYLAPFALCQLGNVVKFWVLS